MRLHSTRSAPIFRMVLTVEMLMLFSLSVELGAQARDIPFSRLSTEHGLPQATVNCVLQDPLGFIWLGTQDGLVRYDGHEMRIYKFDPTDSSSLPSSWILALAEDPSGDLWVGTQGGGIARWLRHSDAFERLDLGPGLGEGGRSSISVRSLTLDRRGNLWVGTFQNGLIQRTPQGLVTDFRSNPEGQDAPMGSLSDDRIRALLEDRDGNLWIGSLGGLDVVSAESLQAMHGDVSAKPVFESFRHSTSDPRSLPSDQVYALLEDQEGSLWIGTKAGLARRPSPSTQPAAGFDRFLHDPARADGLPGPWVTDLLVDGSERLWVATDHGLSLYRDGVFDTYRHDPEDPMSLPSDRVLDLFEDAGGVMWVGTQGGGVAKWHPRAWLFEHFRKGDGSGELSSNAVFAVSEDTDGRLYVGTLGAGVDVLDRESGEVTRFRHDPDVPTSLGGDRVTALFHDRRGDLWVGTLGRGLSRKRAGYRGFEVFRFQPGAADALGDDDISSILEDRYGFLWIATHGGGLARMDPQRQGFTSYRHDPERRSSLSNDHLNTLALGPDGSLWIGTFGGGLNRLDAGRKTFFHHRYNPANPTSLADDKVFALHVDSDGILWVGTAVGLSRLDPGSEPGRFRHYFERDGLPNSSVWGIQSDTRGRLWISTNRGLARFDPATETFRTFERMHGLQADEFNLGAHFASSTGELLFGGVNGLSLFDPLEVEAPIYVPPVVVTSFSKIGEAARFDRGFLDHREISLKSRDYFFTVELAVLDFLAPEKHRFSYQLEGLDKGWVELGNRRSVTFTNLDAGSYRLRLRGSNGEGVAGDEMVMGIRVAPPPWASGWAYGLYALVAVLGVSGFLRVQDRRVRRERQVAERERTINHELRKVDRIRDEFLANTSHELRTPLYGIGGLAEQLLDDPVVGASPGARAHLRTIVAGSRRLTSLVNDILDFSELRRGTLKLHPKSVDIHAAVDVVMALTRPLIGEKDLVLKNEVDPELPSVLADEDRVQQILHNLLGNAVKFTPAGCVKVTAERGRDQLEIRVSDTGIGISADHQEKIFEAFEQEDGSTRRRFGGTGLGLAVSRQLVELSGGTIHVYSAPGHGSTFTFTLPEAPKPADPADDRQAGSPLVSKGRYTMPPEEVWVALDSAEPARWDPLITSRSARILIVDDEPINRQVLSSHLSGAGFELTLCSSGTEALESFGNVGGPPFDLILLDLMMPGMSGYEVCREIRRQYGRDQLPVMLLTAKAQLSDRLAGFQEGANDYLIKPVAKRELIARVSAQLELLWVRRNLEEVVEQRSTMVDQLSKLLPICASCKKIRDDNGAWQHIEVYLQRQSGTKVTHGLCTGCAGQMLAEIKVSDQEARQDH